MTPAGSNKLHILREDLQIDGASRDGRHMVYDPKSDLCCSLGERELRTARLFDGKRSLYDIRDLLHRDEHANVSLDKLAAFRKRLLDIGLLSELGAEERIARRDPATGISYGPLKSLLMIPVFRLDPQGFLDAIHVRAGWLCSKTFVGLATLFILAAFGHALSAREALARDITHLYGSGAGWLLWHYPVVIFSIVCHELGHALACRGYKVRITDLGVAVYLLLATGWARPAQSDWSALRRRERIITIVMGPFASLLVASVGVAIWSMAPIGTPFHTLGTVMAVSVTAGLIPTLLPFFNGDTYLALTELAGMPGMRQNAQRFVKDRLAGRLTVTTVPPARRALYWAVVITTWFGCAAMWTLVAALVAHFIAAVP